MKYDARNPYSITAISGFWSRTVYSSKRTLLDLIDDVLYQLDITKEKAQIDALRLIIDYDINRIGVYYFATEKFYPYPHISDNIGSFCSNLTIKKL